MTDEEASTFGKMVLDSGIWTKLPDDHFNMGLWPQGSLDTTGHRVLLTSFYDGPMHVLLRPEEEVHSSFDKSIPHWDNWIIEDYDPDNGHNLTVPDFRDPATVGILLHKLLGSEGLEKLVFGYLKERF